jgi:ribosomal protein L11 methyltransferase
MVVELPAQAAEALSDALLEHGALSATVEDAAAGTLDERPVFDEPGERAGGWTRGRVTALIDPEVDAAALLAAAAADAGIAPPGFALEDVAETDWVRAAQDQFAPIRVSQRLWIVPSWHTPPDPDALVVVLDPGLAFGTGSHPTTLLCLQWLERQVTPASVVLDYGCGSGILAIAAMRLGARTATGVDIDPDAVAAAEANAARNGVAARFLTSAARLDVHADLVVANILANPLQVLAPVLASHCRPGGRIALAGILDAQAERVVAAYREWFDLAPAGRADGWVGLEGVRR